MGYLEYDENAGKAGYLTQGYLRRTDGSADSKIPYCHSAELAALIRRRSQDLVLRQSRTSNSFFGTFECTHVPAREQQHALWVHTSTGVTETEKQRHFRLFLCRTTNPIRITSKLNFVLQGQPHG